MEQDTESILATAPLPHDDANESIQPIVTAALMGAATVVLFLRLSKRRRSSENDIPRVRARLPFLGSAPAYLASPSEFKTAAHEQYGDTFYMTIMGKDWLMIFSREDIHSLMNQPEKKASFQKAIRELAKLPRDDGKSYQSDEMRMKFAAPDGTPFIAHAVQPARIRAWMPAVREVMVKSLSALPPSGVLDLFDFCKDLICAVTVRILMGKRSDGNDGLLQDWVDRFLEAAPEKAFANPISTLFDVSVHGERSVYSHVRALAFPLIDEEIEKCIAGVPAEDDASVVSIYVRYWYEKKLGRDAVSLRASRVWIANALFTFTFAAFSNTFATAAWIFYHILENTNGVGDKIRAELERMETDDDFFALGCPELEWTMLEVGRLYTPGSIFRKLEVPWTMPSNGKTIPAGTLVTVSRFDAMRNPDIFDRPLDFDPSRYGPGREERKRAGSMFMPFGTGSHPCVGKRFAVLEVAIFVREALEEMNWSLVKQSENKGDSFTRRVINIPNHPELDRCQPAFIWRPAAPVLVRYQRKETGSGL